MSETEIRRPQRLPWIIWALIAVLGVGTLVLDIFAPFPELIVFSVISTLAAAGAFGPIGALVVDRRRNSVGWTLLAIGAGLAITTFTLSYAGAAVAHPGVLPAWQTVAVVGWWFFIPTGGAIALLLMLFPTGTLPSRRSSARSRRS